MANVNGFSDEVKKEKWIRNLTDDMQKLLPFINDESVTDIAIGKGGQVIVEKGKSNKDFTGIFFDDATITRIIYMASSIFDHNIESDFPIVEGVLPNWKIRFEGILPRTAKDNPMIFLRRPSKEIFTLENYLETSRMTQEQYDTIIRHIEKRSNIMLGGETGSGKTTLLNAIVDKMREFTPNDRFYIVEDAGEIQCRADDVVSIFAEGKNCVKAVGTSLRCNAARIIFGELRYGDVTNELLKAWNSGYTGGITTIHANSAMTMLSRVRDLLREVIIGELPDVAQSVQLLVHLTPTKKGPVVNEVVETKENANSSFIEDLEINNLLK